MELDYKKLGLKCGIECHQQLDTGKLFCRCPCKMREDKPDIVFERRIRPIASEMGEYDQAALEAYKKGLVYKYEVYSDSCCEIEADDEPVMPVNSKALDTILEIALMTDSKPVDEIFVMRKAIADGSCVSSFQRTMLVATTGKLKLSNGKEISIPTLILEEDAARPMAKTDQEIVYRLDRLGIPLIELVTGPEIFSPAEAKQVAEKIGELFRLTGKAKRGLGSIRQDINISIAEGARIELKGIQELELIDKYVEREVERQVNLVEIKKELEKRKITEKVLDEKFVDLTELFSKSECKIIVSGLKQGKKVFGVKLTGFAALLGKEIQPERRFGTELASYIRVKENVKGLFHSDELPKYGITVEDIKLVSKKLVLGEKDGFVLVCEGKEKSEAALKVVVDRCRQALKGVPNETRNALEGAVSEYSRPLPGSARMYPETDAAIVKVEEKHLAELEKNLPLNAEERKELYIKKLKLSEKLAEKMKLSNWARFFEELAGKGFDPTTTAVLLLEGLTELKREGLATENVSNELIEELLSELRKGSINKDILLDVLKNWLKDPSKPLSEVISSMNLGKVEDSDLRNLIKSIVEKNQLLIKEKGEHAANALMGDVMKEVRGKASGQEVAKILREEVMKLVGK